MSKTLLALVFPDGKVYDTQCAPKDVISVDHLLGKKRLPRGVRPIYSKRGRTDSRRCVRCGCKVDPGCGWKCTCRPRVRIKEST